MKRTILLGLFICIFIFSACAQAIVGGESTATSVQTSSSVSSIDTTYESESTDLITTFPYTVAGNKMSDEDIKKGFQNLYNGTHDVFFWYYNDASPLGINYEVPAVKDDEGNEYYPIMKLKDLDQLNQVTESVFSSSCAKSLFSHLNRFKDIEGRLYERAGGGFGDPYSPDFSTVQILKKGDLEITIDLDIINNEVTPTTSQKVKFTLLKQGDNWVLDNWIPLSDF